jgi:hypothetical protein
MSVRSYALCPVSNKKVNERVARINGIFTTFLLIAAVSFHSVFPVVFLAIDFFLRASQYSGYSLIAITSKNIVRYLGLNENIINAGPKIFAARIGFIFSVLIIISFLLNSVLLITILSSTLLLFSALEGFFGYCVACEIYPYVYHLLYKGKIQ